MGQQQRRAGTTMHVLMQFQAVADQRRHRAASLLPDGGTPFAQGPFRNAGPRQCAHVVLQRGMLDQ